MAKPIFTTAQIIDQLTTGWDSGYTRSWTGTDVTYSMPTTAPTNAVTPQNQASGLMTMTAIMEQAVRESFELWDDLIAINLNESANDPGANITANYSSTTGGTYALPWLAAPVNGNEAFTAGQIWFDADWEQHLDSWLFLGSAGVSTFVHEIGHSLGLSHPGDYNASDSEAPTYEDDAEFAQDNNQGTIMSYFGGINVDTGLWETGPVYLNTHYFPSTPMLYDIAAIQAKYGADMTTRTGDTVYGFNSTANRAVFDFTQNEHPVLTIYDAGGVDTLDASDYSDDQYININAGVYSDIGGLVGNVGIAYNTAIEKAVGGSGEDLLIGTPTDNTLDGGGNNDVMKGGYGDDIYIVDHAGDDIDEYLNQGLDSVYASVNHTLSAHVEKLYLQGGGDIDGTGNSASNWLFGNGGDNRLDGAGGADTAYGGAGDDTYVVNHVNDFTVENAGDGTDTVEASVSFTLWDHVEALMLQGAGNIDGTGNAAGNFMLGNAGNNVLDGKANADQMYGSLGNDTYVVDSLSDSVVEFAGEGIDTIHTKISLGGLAGEVENMLLMTGAGAINGVGNGLDNVINGNASVNTLTGAGGNDTLNGNGGADVMIGGIGNDNYQVDHANDTVTENAGEGADWVYSSIAYTLGAQVENLGLFNSGGAINGVGNGLDNTMLGNSSVNVLKGAGGADSLYGNGQADALSGGDGADILDGGTGADDMHGGADNDWFYVDNANDHVFESASGGQDRVFASVNYSLGLGSAVEMLTTTNNGGLAPLMLGGNELSNTIYGNAGDNVLIGDLGADTLVGLGGNDWFVVESALDTVFEAVGGGDDAVYSSAPAYTLKAGAEIERLETTDKLGVTAINLTGNELGGFILGNDGVNILDGKGGADTMNGRAGDDWYYVDNAGDVVLDTAATGADRVWATVSYTLAPGGVIETLSTNSFAGLANINLTGNGFDNTVAGNAGSNGITGLAGNDILYGGGGVDSFVFNTAPNAAINVDQILDFTVADDTFVMQDGVFTGLAAGVLSAAAFVTGAAAADASDRIVYNSATGALFYDADGLGGVAQVQFASVTAGLALTNADFLVV